MDPKRLAIRNAIRKPKQHYKYDESQDMMTVIEELMDYNEDLLGAAAMNGYLVGELASELSLLAEKANRLPN